MMWLILCAVFVHFKGLVTERGLGYSNVLGKICLTLLGIVVKISFILVLDQNRT